MDRSGITLKAMITYYEKDTRRINHFLKVFGFAKTIGSGEGLNPELQELLEIAAITHDIGIKNSEKKYNSASGHYQQIEGPVDAAKLLADLHFEQELIDRVCWLIGHHHTYVNIEGIDYQILVEADFLVNINEDNMSREAIASVREKIFKTKTGLFLLDSLYGDG